MSLATSPPPSSPHSVRGKLHSAPATPPPLFVRDTGRGSPLVLVHGLASSSRYWEPHFETLGQSYRVIAPDLLGFGRSPKPFDGAYTPEQHLAALTAQIERRVDRPVTLVGHSMGSVLALRLAVERPDLVERLLLVSLPAIGSCAWGHHPDGGYRRFHHFAVHTRPGRALFSVGQHAIQPVASSVYPRLRRDIPEGAARDSLKAGWTAYWRSLEAVVYGSDVEGLFAAVPGPFTVMHGAGDMVVPVAPVRELARSRADVRYIELDGAGHNPCFTHAAAFYAALDERLEPEASRDSRLPPSTLVNTVLEGYTLLSRRSAHTRQ
jgi:pimeloyl-ACP methyl ester carboxylesterase